MVCDWLSGECSDAHSGMFYTEFDHLIDEKYKKVDLFPENLRKQIEEHNDWTYNDINNGVYKSGFATYGLSLPTINTFA